MKLIIQNVASAHIDIFDDSGTLNQGHNIKKGIIIYFGVAKADEQDNYRQKIDKFIDKLTRLRFLKDEDGDLTSTLGAIDADILIVSNFTLYANHKKGSKMDFSPSARYDEAKIVYDYFVEKMSETFGTEKIKTGKFGAMMEITSKVVGPVNYDIEL